MLPQKLRLLPSDAECFNVVGKICMSKMSSQILHRRQNILRLGIHAAIFKLPGGSISIDESGGEQFVKTHRDGVE